jgi:hypothetical protein
MDMSATQTMQEAPPTMFDLVAKRDYDGLVAIYATNAQNAVVSYLSMRSRWASASSLRSLDEEKSGELIL